MSQMFNGCRKLKELDLSFITVNLTTATNMLYNCKALETVTAPSDIQVAIALPYVADYMWVNENGDKSLVIETELDASMIYTRTTATEYTFAIYSADDTSLRFYEDVSLPTVGSTYRGYTVTAFYSGIDADSYTSYSSVPWYSKYRTAITSVMVEDEISVVGTLLFSKRTLI